jgi:hypothetical protein
VVILNKGNYQQGAVYPSLSAWYERAIRATFAGRYGLKQTA